MADDWAESRGHAAEGLLGALKAALLGRPLRLPADLLAEFPELAGARWRVGGLPPRVGGWGLGLRTAAGITLWRTVWLAPEARLDPRLLLHELRHVQQFEASPLFPLLYLLNAIARGYRRNRYERDAESFALARLAERGRPSPEG